MLGSALSNFYVEITRWNALGIFYCDRTCVCAHTHTHTYIEHRTGLISQLFPVAKVTSRTCSDLTSSDVRPHLRDSFYERGRNSRLLINTRATVFPFFFFFFFQTCFSRARTLKSRLRVKNIAQRGKNERGGVAFEGFPPRGYILGYSR